MLGWVQKANSSLGQPTIPEKPSPTKRPTIPEKPSPTERPTTPEQSSPPKRPTISVQPPSPPYKSGSPQEIIAANRKDATSRKSMLDLPAILWLPNPANTKCPELAVAANTEVEKAIKKATSRKGKRGNYENYNPDGYIPYCGHI